jgi:hypothetical protein
MGRICRPLPGSKPTLVVRPNTLIEGGPQTIFLSQMNRRSESMKTSVNLQVLWFALLAFLVLTAGLGVIPAQSEGLSTVTFYVY